MKRTIGDFLLDRLSQIGIKDILGVPGDYNLQFLIQTERRNDIKFVGTRNELNGAYAADGYARLNGISALLTTYGVGDLSAINGIAGAYAEYVPIVCITGAPPLNSMYRRRSLHHTTAEGNFEDIMSCYRPFTVAQARITPQNAVEEIDRVLRACVRKKRPVYLQIPSDITFFEIDVYNEKLSLRQQTSDLQQLNAVVESIEEKLAKAENPSALLGMALDRFGLRDLSQSMIENLQIPFATLSAAQCVLDGDHPQWIGGYSGRSSSDKVKAAIEQSDCLFGLNVKFTDSNSSYFTQHVPENMINIRPFRTIIGHEVYEGVSAIELLDRLSKITPPKKYKNWQSNPPKVKDAWKPVTGEKLIQNRFWQRVESFIKPHDVVVTEAGTSMRGVKILDMPSGITIISQPLWLSIGYSLPALFGSLMAKPNRRQVIFIGDGSFQLTAQEVSSFFEHDLKPIIFLINNRGYTIERAIMGFHSKYNDIPNWNYRQLFDAFSDGKEFFSRQVNTEEEFENALNDADKVADKQLCLIEVMFDPLDIPKAVQSSANMVAAFNYGPRGLKELDKNIDD
ncbi:TPP-dependent 2-oxoacid decarboxylase [Commensalibacter communis]|uniref:Includes indolepyruvate decarboxylase (PDC1) n=1 Tax=Commensalibacter communis TaxID=2972786 RepID=A0A9W4TK13_9PROT|nr:thiamine pyrophosphate-binding protein [Commensalibacter communis]CAI3924863.1 TPP-dependent 2-oxoacid decarboxylase [Commensalibacter communis]CAI3926368.1 TPP-dependent 2-oxoacid decarboxylase [Commensalibacter communis]CAI3926383.1 TPP-dependent 2-oxoacid decarboxylase [Commensalibacter communis]CAI3927357.1 TPP-dependent 2-oxoacid decarboxylase [Commensalibacter communis]CAI3928287.1 TPP-dependent 2-oxoacid decarboxylase [Commensalibacter communis]